MFGGKKHQEEIRKLQEDVVESKEIAVEETAEAASKVTLRINKAVKQGLTNLNFSLGMEPEEHKFVGDIIRILPLLSQQAIYQELGLESPISPIPKIELTADQVTFFSGAYDLRVSPHDSTDHIELITVGNVESSMSLFEKIMQRYISQKGGENAKTFEDNLNQAKVAFANFEEFINEVAADPHNRFAYIEGGSSTDRYSMIEQFIAKSGKKSSTMSAYRKPGDQVTNIQPCEVMRALENLDVLFIKDPNKISNLSELIEDIENAEQHVLVVFGEAFDLNDRQVPCYTISQEDEGITYVWKYL